jgi:hypothetical protein
MKTTVQLESRLANRRAQRFNKQKIANAIRMMAPTLFALTFASVAHAQGTMDFSGAQTLMGTFNDRLAYVAISRASDDARVYTNNAETLGERLASEITKTVAVDFTNVVSAGQAQKSFAPPRGRPVAPDVELEGFSLGI